MRNFRSQDKGFYLKADQFLMDSSICLQCSFLEDHLPRDFLSQFEFSVSDSIMMEYKQILYGMYMMTFH